MKTETCSYEDVRHLFGPLDDHLGKEIMELSPTTAELEIAAAYIAGLTDVTGDARTPLTGKAARVYEIVSRDELLDEEDRRA